MLTVNHSVYNVYNIIYERLLVDDVDIHYIMLI